MMFLLRALPLIVLASLAPAGANAQDAAAFERSGSTPPLEAATSGGRLSLQTGSDGEIVLYSSGATRRELLARLFDGQQVEIEWRHEAYADVTVQGRLRGPQSQIARQLLAGINHIATYDNGSNDRRLARIVILGSDPPSVTRVERALLPAERQVQPGEAWRRLQAIETAKRAIAKAQAR